MSWIDNISNKQVESVKYALNYDLDENEKKLLNLSINHDYLVDWITKPFDKFGYSDELKSVRKYYRLNFLKENDFGKISSILNWDVRSLGLKKRIKYFLGGLFVAKDRNLIASFIFYIFTISAFSIAMNIEKIKALSNYSIMGIIFFFIVLLSICGAFLVNFFLPTMTVYKKAIFFDIYGNTKEQEIIKNTALKTIMEISGVYKNLEEPIKTDKDFLSNIEGLSQKYKQTEFNPTKIFNSNKYINFCEEVYNQSNLFSKIDYSYDELLQKNKEKLILEQKSFLEESLNTDVGNKKNKKIKI